MNMVLDFLIAVFIIAYGAPGLAVLDSSHGWYEPALAVKILAYIGLGFAMIVG